MMAYVLTKSDIEELKAHGYEIKPRKRLSSGAFGKVIEATRYSKECGTQDIVAKLVSWKDKIATECAQTEISGKPIE